MNTVSIERISQAKPLWDQADFRAFHNTAHRILLGRRMAERLGRRLTRAQLQLFAVGDALNELLKGELGGVMEDDAIEPIGHLILTELPRERKGTNGR